MWKAGTPAVSTRQLGACDSNVLRCHGGCLLVCLLALPQYRATKKIVGAHGDSIWSVAWAGNSRLVTGSLDEVVKTWYVPSGSDSPRSHPRHCRATPARYTPRFVALLRPQLVEYMMGADVPPSWPELGRSVVCGHGGCCVLLPTADCCCHAALHGVWCLYRRSCRSVGVETLEEERKLEGHQLGVISVDANQAGDGACFVFFWFQSRQRWLAVVVITRPLWCSQSSSAAPWTAIFVCGPQAAGRLRR